MARLKAHILVGADEGRGTRSTVSRVPQPSSAPIGAEGRAVSQPFLMENMLLKTSYTFKTSYGVTPEPQTTLGAPSVHGPSLKTSTKFSTSRCRYI
jgi:hypothetical protein